jgi:hypothetical protein
MKKEKREKFGWFWAKPYIIFLDGFAQTV